VKKRIYTSSQVISIMMLFCHNIGLIGFMSLDIAVHSLVSWSVFCNLYMNNDEVHFFEALWVTYDHR
jgi:hypothetical protein